jgi:DNA-binding winged helix-turn-helix (wHTH) protein/TolB-like protein/Tfp pilus assembly protein PilF
MSTANQFRNAWQEPGSPVLYHFGPFVLDTAQHVLLKEGKPVSLTPKTYDTLLVLVRNGGRMLSKEELMNALWPDSFVEEANLTQQVSMVRKALGESPSDPHYIVTVASRGYRFAAEVRQTEVQQSDARPTEIQLAEKEKSGSVPFDAQAESVTLRAESMAPAYPPPNISQADKNKNGNTLYGIVIGTAAIILLALATLTMVKWSHHGSPSTAQFMSPPKSLAILPLQNLRQTPADDFLGFSLADAIITKLDYVSSVTIRPSAYVQKYRNQVVDIRKVADELKVDSLVTGNFIHDGDKLRITYQMIDVKTEKILGRGTMDLKYDDLLQVQDNVAQRIVQELNLELSPAEAEKIKLDAPINPLAYEYYLRGVDLHGQHNFPLAIKMLEKSTEIDPNYAPTWAYLGASYTSHATFELGGREQYRRAQAAYERALTLQPAQLDAQIFLANLLVDTGKVEQAVPLLRNALKTNPNYAAAHWELGYAYRFAGMLNESLAECERALQIDPLVKANGSVLNTYLYLGQYDKFLLTLPDPDDSSFFLFYRGYGEYYQKHWERATRDFDHAYKIDPSLYARIGKAFGESIAGRKSNGLEIVHGLEGMIHQRGVGDPEAEYKIAQAYALLGDKVSALRALRRSIESGFFCHPYMLADPLLNGLRQEPEFDQILGVARQRHQEFAKHFFT